MQGQGGWGPYGGWTQTPGGWNPQGQPQAQVPQGYPQAQYQAFVPPQATQHPLVTFQSTGVYHHRAPIAALVGDIQGLREHDQLIEARARSLGKTATWMWVLCLICFVLGFLVWPLFLLFVVFFICGIVYSVKWGRAKKLDLENRRYELAARLLDMLARDAGDGYVQLFIDLRPAEHGAKLARQWKVSPWTFEEYRDPWLWMQGAFVDGNVFTVTVTERKRVRKGWKRTARGKLKHKTKSKSKHYFGLELSVRDKKHPYIDRIAANAYAAVQLPPYVQPRSLRCKEGELRLKTCVLDWAEPGPGEHSGMYSSASVAFASMFLSLYQVVQLSKKVAKAHPQPA